MTWVLIIAGFIIIRMDYLFADKNAPAALSRHLKQLIETIGETKTKEQEEKIINA